MVRRVTRALTLLLVVTTIGWPGRAPAHPERPPVARALPAVNAEGFADPAVVPYAGGYLAVVTGPHAPRATAPSAAGPWTRVGPALPELPSWVRSDAIWASDLVQAGDRWVLYYSAPVRGLGVRGRCIGVATATDPLGSFHAQPWPLVCPHQADTPRAGDQAGSTHPRRRLPRLGVIDPSSFTDGGRRFLLYKTQGTPSSIRLLRLRADGTGRMPGRRSRELFRSHRIVENPAMIRHAGRLTLFTSEGYYRSCRYRTTWRRSPSLEHWRTVERGVLVERRGPRICGPGGADVVHRSDGRRMVFLHGWTCWSAQVACPPRRNLERDLSLHARRSLFAAWLLWRKGRPVLRFVG